MKLLGIDYGRKRLGLAVCGPLRIACPAGIVIHATWEKDLAALSAVVRRHEIAKIVVGFPKNMDDSTGEMGQEVTRFAAALRNYFRIPVEMWDERLTSWQAEHILQDACLARARRKNYRDAIAACLILQSYVDSHQDFLDQEG